VTPSLWHPPVRIPHRSGTNISHSYDGVEYNKHRVKLHLEGTMEGFLCSLLYTVISFRYTLY